MEENWEARCQALSERVLAERDWTLAQDSEQFLHEVRAEARQRLTAKRTFEEAVRLAVVNRYCVLLYEACAGTDRARQRRAFEELARHLERVASHKGQPPELVVEFRQRALKKIWENLNRLQDKGAFFDWCNQILLNEIADSYRKQKQQEITWSELFGPEDDAEELLEENVLNLRAPGQEYVKPEQDELREQLSAVIRACLKNETQQQIIIELFLNEKSLLQVAEQFGLTLNHVNVHRFRALKTFRKCDEFNLWYQDWLK